MSTTTSPDNIFVLETSDTDGPSAWQPAMATSVQNALLSRALQTFKWANITERNAQVDMRQGDLGYQEDNGFTYQYDTVNGWEQVLPIVTPSPIIASGTITAQSALVIDGLVGFREYEIVLNLPTSSTANQLVNMRLRAGGVADSSANYDQEIIGSAAGVAVAGEVLGGTSWSSIYGDRTDKIHTFRFISLNQTMRTFVQGLHSGWDAAPLGVQASIGLRHRSSVAFDGFEFGVSSGTVTGEYTVRGIE